MDIPIWLLLVILLFTPALVPLFWLGGLIQRIGGVRSDKDDDEDVEGEEDAAAPGPEAPVSKEKAEWLEERWKERVRRKKGRPSPSKRA